MIVAVSDLVVASAVKIVVLAVVSRAVMSYPGFDFANVCKVVVSTRVMF